MSDMTGTIESASYDWEGEVHELRRRLDGTAFDRDALAAEVTEARRVMEAHLIYLNAFCTQCKPGYGAAHCSDCFIELEAKPFRDFLAREPHARVKRVEALEKVAELCPAVLKGIEAIPELDTYLTEGTMSGEEYRGETQKTSDLKKQLYQALAEVEAEEKAQTDGSD